MKRSVALLPLTVLIAACSANVGDDAIGSDAQELITLTPEGCLTPNVTTAPKSDAQGNPIHGTAKTSLHGCIVGKPGEAGTGTAARAAAILASNEKLATMTDSQDRPYFKTFTPAGPPTGTLQTGQKQFVNVVLNAEQNPKGQMELTRKSDADGSFTMASVNNKPITVKVLFVTVEVIKQNNLTLNVVIRPEENGITVTGTSEVTLEHQQDQAGQASQMVKDVFAWLTEELAR
jgi:hypothetical protein